MRGSAFGPNLQLPGRSASIRAKDLHFAPNKVQTFAFCARMQILPEPANFYMSSTTIRTRSVPSAAEATLRMQGFTALQARLLAARGAVEASQSPDLLLPYVDLKGVLPAAEFIARQIEAGRRLCVVADYDADGATACAVMVRGLRALGADIGYKVPDRMKHGYGLTPAIVEEAFELSPRPQVLITVDNGIASNAGVSRAMELGMEVVVTDHHLPADEDVATPYVVNPNQRQCGFGSKALAGCGVAWYTVWAVRDYLMRTDVDLMALLPIVAVGTVADVVPLDFNNRLLVREGISLIRDGNCIPAITALAKIGSRDQQNLTTTDIAFSIGPCINAAGRLSTMDMGIECLLTDDMGRAEELAKGLFETNTERKGVEAEMVNDAIGELVAGIRPEQFSVVLRGDDWHAGVIGIVAGRVRELVNRPTFVMAPDGAGGYKGSGRSIPGFHLRDALDLVSKRQPGLLTKFGGHAMAAGLTLAPGAFEGFCDAFEAVSKELLTDEMLERVLDTDGSLPDEFRTLDVAHWMRSQMWGQAFPEPLFVDEFAVVDHRAVGADKSHLQLTLARGGSCYKAIRFRHGDAAVPERVRVAYSLGVNRWREQDSLQLLVQYLEAA